MKKLISFLLISNCLVSIFAAELTAKFVTTEAAKKETVEESVSYLKTQISKMTSAADKRAAYVFLASLEEQMALYDDAQKSYAQAAGISAGDCEGMPKKSNEQIVLDAVRCALSSGDYKTADSYLNSAVRNSKDEKIQAYIKLYSQWSALCKADSVADIQEPLVMLQAYTKIDSMEVVKPVILLTLWYLTGDKSYSQQISSKYPKSIESSIVKGDAQLLPTPFWFFVPKSGEAEMGTGSYTSVSSATLVESPAESSSGSKKEGSSNRLTKWQLGLFRTESNAKLLVDELKSKDFAAYITTETRASGTTYYIVLVNEDSSGNMADKLRNAGYDCYGVE
jgi:tetratricopeptide (TPR) repeat protein